MSNDQDAVCGDAHTAAHIPGGSEVSPRLRSFISLGIYCVDSASLGARQTAMETVPSLLRAAAYLEDNRSDKNVMCTMESRLNLTSGGGGLRF